MGEARVLGLPESAGLPRSLRDREGYAAHAAPEAIAAELKRARRKAMDAANDVAWLEVLFARRCQQVANGTWPPPRTEPEGGDRA